MTGDEDIIAVEATNASQREAMRRAALLALGIDPATVVWPSEDVLKDAEPAVQPPEPAELSDGEWLVIAPFLPPEAPQANAMSNRAFLDAVIAVMRRGGAWTSRHTPAPRSKPFAAALGAGRTLACFRRWRTRLPSLDLPPERKRLLALAGQRAAHLKARAHPREREQ